MALVNITVPFINMSIKELWFATPNIYFLSLIPVITAWLFWYFPYGLSWAWFALLWIGGILNFVFLAYPFKALINLMR